MQVVDLGDLTRSRIVHAVGNSGRIGSPHYADQYALWHNNEYRPQLWSRGDVLRAKKHRMVLVPISLE
jgi:penicillin G amidase